MVAPIPLPMLKSWWVPGRAASRARRVLAGGDGEGFGDEAGAVVVGAAAVRTGAGDHQGAEADGGEAAGGGLRGDQLLGGELGGRVGGGRRDWGVLTEGAGAGRVVDGAGGGEDQS